MDELVSVIIPTYNRANFLGESIESIWQQTHRPIEVLIIDDGSTDNTKQKIFNLKNKLEDENFKIIYKYQNNHGANNARNSGLKLASGAWVQFLDSDDLLEKNKFKIQIKSLIETNSDMAICNFKKLTNSKKILFVNNSGDLLKKLSCGYSIHISTPLFKKKLLKYVEWNEKLYREQDKEFIYKAILQSKKYVYVNYFLSTYRMHDKSQISENYSKTPLQTFENIKSDLALIFSSKIKLRKYATLYVSIHILYLMTKKIKRGIKHFIFRKYSFKYND